VALFDMVKDRAAAVALQTAGRIMQARSAQQENARTYVGTIIDGEADDGMQVLMSTGEIVTAYPGFRSARTNDHINVVGTRIFS
jgi:hypothetical protein